MLSTILSFIALQANSSAVQWFIGTPTDSGFCNDKLIMWAICSIGIYKIGFIIIFRHYSVFISSYNFRHHMIIYYTSFRFHSLNLCQIASSITRECFPILLLLIYQLTVVLFIHLLPLIMLLHSFNHLF